MPEFPDETARNALAEECRRCPALVESRQCISWGNGPRDADLVVVGEAPAAGDPEADRWQGGNLTGMAYTARRSGRKIRDLLADVGFPDAYYTNAVRCHPPGNRDPTDAELDNCRPYLIEEIDAVDPVAVLTTGKHATRTVLSFEGIELDGFLDSVLEPRECARLETVVVPLLHPSYQEVWLARLGYDREEYVATIRDAIEHVTDPA